MKLLQTAFALALSVAFASAEYYQLSTYQLNSPEKAAAFDKMMAAGVPALNRAGISEVGVFKARGGDKDGDPNWRYVLSAASSIDTFAEARVALASDGEFLEQARDYLSYEKSDPAYARISVSTFVAFDGFPSLVKPEGDGGGKRFFEIREYQSHSEFKAFMKVKMFNDGELDIFDDVGLEGVFFGSALSGPDLPNLTYMLVYESDEAKKKAWDTFKAAPAWKAMSSDEQYKDTVSKIISKFLVALPYSGIK